ncbi:MAG: WYL domain-containing protein, partial [Meiothermus sp.]
NLLEVYFLEVSRTNLGMYVIGYERGYHKALRTYKLSRMRRVRLVGEPGAYTIPKDFDPREYLSNAWGVIGSSGRPPVEVRLLFRPEAVYRVEEGGYPNLQIIQKHPDGSLEVSITTGTDNDNFPLELLSWVQSWGARVEVLAPENLRRRWLEEARQVAAICDRI